MRKLLALFRIVQYYLYGRYKVGVLEPGELVKVEPFRFEINHGDVVHPCVRIIPEGYLGHHWWLVYTPYYGADSSLENPVLCYSEEEQANTPPMNWKTFCLINEKPADGYNSDPTLFFNEGTLYVYWRENYEWSNRPHKFIRATYMAKIVDGGIERVGSEILYTRDPEVDAETCPTFMKDDNNGVMAYAMHLKFHSQIIKKLNPKLKSLANKFLAVTDLLGIYSQQKHYGIAIWKQNGLHQEAFEYVKTVRIDNCNKLYRPWHMDFFEWDGKRYAVIQSNQSNADIVLAVSEDMETFSMFKQPLITNATMKNTSVSKLTS